MLLSKRTNWRALSYERGRATDQSHGCEDHNPRQLTEVGVGGAVCVSRFTRQRQPETKADCKNSSKEGKKCWREAINLLRGNYPIMKEGKKEDNILT